MNKLFLIAFGVLTLAVTIGVTMLTGPAPSSSSLVEKVSAWGGGSCGESSFCVPVGGSPDCSYCAFSRCYTDLGHTFWESSSGYVGDCGGGGNGDGNGGDSNSDGNGGDSNSDGNGGGSGDGDRDRDGDSNSDDNDGDSNSGGGNGSCDVDRDCSDQKRCDDGRCVPRNNPPPSPGTPPPPPPPKTQCNDGIDNDGDGKIDREDAGCLNPLYDPRDNSEFRLRIKEIIPDFFR